MARANSRPVVAMEIFVEENIVPPMGIRLEFFSASINRPSAISVACEGSNEPVSNFIRDFKHVHQTARTGRTLHSETITIVLMQIQERADNHDVDRHPDRPTPVRVSAEQPGIGLSRHVPNRIFLTFRLENIWMV